MQDGSRRLARSRITREGKEKEWPTVTEYEDLKLSNLQTVDDLMEMEEYSLALENHLDEAWKSSHKWENRYNVLKAEFDSTVAMTVRVQQEKLIDQIEAYTGLLQTAEHIIKRHGLHGEYMADPQTKPLMRRGGFI